MCHHVKETSFINTVEWSNVNIYIGSLETL